MSLFEIQYHQGGVFLPKLGLWLDSPEPQSGPERVFVSHAHSDHVEAHREVIVSAPTAKLMEARIGAGSRAWKTWKSQQRPQPIRSGNRGRDAKQDFRAVQSLNEPCSYAGGLPEFDGSGMEVWRQEFSWLPGKSASGQAQSKMLARSSVLGKTRSVLDCASLLAL